MADAKKGRKFGRNQKYNQIRALEKRGELNKKKRLVRHLKRMEKKMAHAKQHEMKHAKRLKVARDAVRLLRTSRKLARSNEHA